jgi:hypothetical protein
LLQQCANGTICRNDTHALQVFLLAAARSHDTISAAVAGRSIFADSKTRQASASSCLRRSAS